MSSHSIPLHPPQIHPSSPSSFAPACVRYCCNLSHGGPSFRLVPKIEINHLVSRVIEIVNKGSCRPGLVLSACRTVRIRWDIFYALSPHFEFEGRNSLVVHLASATPVLALSSGPATGLRHSDVCCSSRVCYTLLQ